MSTGVIKKSFYSWESRESRLLLGLWMSTPIGISGLQASLAPSLVYVKQKENPGRKLTHHVFGPGCPKPVCLSFHRPVSYNCFINSIQGL